MTNALISFSLCSGILLGVYHLWLKGKTLYRFNRYYLLFSLAFSLAVPFITIKTSVPAIEALKPAEENILILPAYEPQQAATQYQLPAHTITPAARISHQSNNYWPYILWGFYILVALILFSRFCRNLYLVSSAIKRGEQLSYNGATLVLSPNELSPYTFLKYIFLNSDDYHNQNIDPAILDHELSHARELHSIDIILIELLQAVCWFNPFIPFYRKTIELNHEFIADAAALSHKADIVGYQYLLLNTVSHISGLSIASQFNYLTIKKRLIMMNRSTTAAKAIVAKAAIVPVFIATFLLFCAKSDGFALPVVSKDIKTAKTAKVKKPADSIAKPARINPFITKDYPCTKDGVSEATLKQYQQIVGKYIDPTTTLWYSGKTDKMIAPDDRAKLLTIFKQMSREQQSQQLIGFSYPGQPLAPKTPTQVQLDAWKNPKVCGVWIDEKKVDNSVLNNYKPSDFGLAFASKLMPTAINYKKYKYQVDLYTRENYAKIYKQQMAEQHTSRMYFRMKPKA
jgi:bla regulator protein blaR1